MHHFHELHFHVIVLVLIALLSYFYGGAKLKYYFFYKNNIRNLNKVCSFFYKLTSCFLILFNFFSTIKQVIYLTIISLIDLLQKSSSIANLSYKKVHNYKCLRPNRLLLFRYRLDKILTFGQMGRK
jgi:hypothetical protein